MRFVGADNGLGDDSEGFGGPEVQWSGELSDCSFHCQVTELGFYQLD
jgi:hypothetical protein